MSRDHTDERLRRIVAAQRDAFFEEFGPLDDMSEAEMGDCIRSLVAIHAGELIEIAARFGKRPIRETVIDFIDAMMKSNPTEIARLVGHDDPITYLSGERP